ncbi:hypothetical protein IX307_001970 [Bacteroides pyogenes]|nr:hypothetical protein [Bacteroides pyogenes]MBR8720820.1 hypothetical protein [Bacteroides pyogenes]MBR8724287.1 hypothetical protein [Bacteroides pyogenes]MBR8737470.1 hypothetical protein [Bacteroides pyogenes]MBR8753513.1 hypothetical protein [Bacteroides pyogenes]
MYITSVTFEKMYISLTYVPQHSIMIFNYLPNTYDYRFVHSNNGIY